MLTPADGGPGIMAGVAERSEQTGPQASRLSGSKSSGRSNDRSSSPIIRPRVVPHPSWEAIVALFRKWGWLLTGCLEILEATNYWRENRGEGVCLWGSDLFLNSIKSSLSRR